MLQGAVSGWGSEHMHEIIVILKNFVRKGGDFIFSASDLFGVSFFDLLLYFVNTVYAKCATHTFEEEEESAMKDSLSVLYSLLETHV